MTKKSAAQVKVIKPEIEDKVEVTEEDAMKALATEFEATKEVYLMTLDAQIKTAGRIDNMLNIRDFASKFWNEGCPKYNDIEYLKMLQELSVDTYRKIREASEQFELDEFMKTSMKDYYEDILVNDPDDVDELIKAGIIFLSVQPYGQKMLGMHQYIQQCMDELGIEHPEEDPEK